MIKGVLPAPIKHTNIPDEALWLAGEGAGSWFYIQTQDTNYLIFRYSPDGKIECSGVFKITDGVGFVANNSFRITYPSHCNLVTIIQEGRKTVFGLIERNNF